MTYTDEELLDEIKKATEEQGREVTYDYFNDRDGPATRTLELRFGTFTKAKRLAGVSKKGFAGKMPVDSTFFQEIDSDESAYWLGMLYGDGWITEENKNDKVSLGLIDKEHIVKFKKALNASQSITEHDKKEENSTWRLCIADQQLVDSLRSKGCDKEKTFSNTLPDIETQYYSAFVRGLFDADGSYQERGTTFKLHGASEGRLKKVIEWLPSDGAITEENREFCLRVNQHHGVFELWGWLYPEGEKTQPALERKLNKNSCLQ